MYMSERSDRYLEKKLFRQFLCPPLKSCNIFLALSDKNDFVTKVLFLVNYKLSNENWNFIIVDLNETHSLYIDLVTKFKKWRFFFLSFYFTSF